MIFGAVVAQNKNRSRSKFQGLPQNMGPSIFAKPIPDKFSVTDAM
jgi:hypothetical protein